MADERPSSVSSSSSFKEEAVVDSNHSSGLPVAPEDSLKRENSASPLILHKATPPKRTFFSIDDILSEDFTLIKKPRPIIVRPWDLPTSDSVSSRSGFTSSKSDKSKLKGSPLDALLKMANKTFEGLEKSDGRTGTTSPSNCSINGASSNNSKKKRKSRTAFTNTQVFELEKRFLYQKYLSPADRDEIAQSLGLSNAQVITWFQNRRAKLKRDIEELKKDVTATRLHTLQKSLYDNVRCDVAAALPLLRAKYLSDVKRLH